MASPLPRPPRWQDTWPIFLLVAVTAMWPAPGTILVLMGLVALWAKRGNGTWPWQPEFWDAMQWPVAGALGIITLGIILHVMLVRPMWAMGGAGS